MNTEDNMNDLEDQEEPTATPEEQKDEAIERMKLLKIFPETIRQFEEEGLVSISEPPIGAHYWADDEIKQAITEFQNEYGSLVYYGIKTVYREIGTMYSLFYVSRYKGEWELDRDDLNSSQQVVYVFNQSNPVLSESGAIGYEMGAAGGLLRTW